MQVRKARFAVASIVAIAVAFSVPLAKAQTQASCNFKVFSLNQSHPNNPATHPWGVNDNTTVVGYGDFPNATPGFKAFVRKSGGATSYWLPSGALWSWFNNRNNNGTTVGGYVDASKQGHAVILQGSTVTEVNDPKAQPGSTMVHGVNKFNTTVGQYTGLKGKQNGFKRYSSGGFVDVDYPGSNETLPWSINDNGTIVGTYHGSDTEDHGFIYRNGSFATLDYLKKPSQTDLYGISNAGVIVGDAAGPVAFLYKNGKFERIAVPNLPPSATTVRGISADGIISGEVSKSGHWYGYTATCQ